MLPKKDHGCLLSWSDPKNEKIATVGDNFIPRDYQIEMLNRAKEENTIVMMPTGSGKTFVAVLLIKHNINQVMSDPWKGKNSKCQVSEKECGFGTCGCGDRNWKRTFFLVNQVTLVSQQATVLKNHTGVSVGCFSGGSTGIDTWDELAWYYEFKKHQILVMTAQIFLNIISSGILSVRNVNVLVLDECHHAKENHSMAVIMRDYWTLKKPSGRVLGLTASVIDKKKIKGIFELQQSIEKLQKMLDARLVTPRVFVNQMNDIILPDPELYTFNNDNYCRELLLITDTLLQTINEYSNKSVPEEERSSFIHIKKIVTSLPQIILEIGIDSLLTNLRDERGYIAEIGNYLANPCIAPLKDEHGDQKECLTYKIGTVVLSMLKSLTNSVISIIENGHEVRMSVKFYDLVKYLLKLQDTHKDKGEVPKVIVFVERRRVVMAMYKYLHQLRNEVESFAGFKASYVLGGTTGRSEKDADLNFSDFELLELQTIRKQQDQALLDFRDGKTNILIATSVVEEGLDIPNCNVVIRYDFPPTYRAYVQSRGRARKLPAKFVFFISVKELNEKKAILKNFDDIEQLLKKYATDQGSNIPEADEDNEQHDYNLLIPPIEVAGTGAKVTAISAIQRLNFYCSQLPKDEYTQTLPTDETIQRIDDSYQTKIILPKLCPINQFIEGDPMPTKKLAKMSAAMKTLQVLYNAKELTDALLPLFRQKESDTLRIKSEDGRYSTVDQKLKVPSVFWRNNLYEDSGIFYLYSIHLSLKPSIEDFSEYFVTGKDHQVACFGILTKSELPDFPQFDIFPRYGIVTASIKFQRKITVPVHVLSSYFWFQEALFSHILNLSNLKMWQGVHFKTYFILPLCLKVNGFQFLSSNSNNSGYLDIDARFINQLKKQWDSENNHWIYGNAPEDLEKCLDSILFPAYNFPEHHNNKQVVGDLYAVTKISDITAKHTLRGRSNKEKGTAEALTYEEHHLKNHKIQLMNPDKNLLSCRHVTSHYDYFSHKDGDKDKYAKSINMFLIAEIQKVHPMPASLWNQATCLPSILWRLETFCLANELSKTVYHESNLNITILASHYNYYFKNEIPDLRAMLRRDLVYRGEIDWLETLQAVTHQACHEPYSLERFEFLGDRFLKLIGTLFYYRTMPDKHEGWLSKFRSQLISNHNLSVRSCKVIKLPRFILNKRIDPKKNWIPPCHIPSHLADKLDETSDLLDKASSVDLENMCNFDPEDSAESMQAKNKLREAKEYIEVKNYLLTQPKNDSTSEALLKLCEMIPDEYLQRLQMKDVADCMEALLGLCVAKYGYRKAVELLDKIEITTFHASEKAEKAELINDHIYELTPKSQIFSLSDGTRHFAMSRYASLRHVEKTLNYTFKDPLYLVEALTHASYPEIDTCYQRLEFLGDAVLDVLMVFHIYEDRPEYDQGQMTDLLSSLVCNTTLSKICTDLKLHQSILYNSVELYNVLARFYVNFTATELAEWCKDLSLERVFVGSVVNDIPDKLLPIDLDYNVVQTPKILGDIVESVIGAIYLDSGEDINCVWDVIWPWFEYFYKNYSLSPPKNSKVLVNEAYPFLKRQVIAYPGDAYRYIATITLVTSGKEGKEKKYEFKTIARDQETAMEVSYGRAWHFHMKYLQNTVQNSE